MIYISIGFFIILLAFLDAVVKSKKLSQINSLFILCILLLLASLRVNVGTDWDAYYEFYQNTTDSTEIGYSLINNLFSNLGFHYNLFLFLINGFALSFMFFFLRRNALLSSLGLLLYFSDLFLYYNLSGFRQAIALSITCFSINYAINNKTFLFFLTVIIASTFHITAISFLIVYFIPRNRIGMKKLLLFSAGFIFVAIFLQTFSDIITLYNLKNADFYLNQQEKSEDIKSFYLIGILKRSILVVVVIFFRDRLFKLPNSNYFFNIYLFGYAVYLSTYLVSPDIGSRLSSYFTIFEIILVGNLLYTFNGIKFRLLITSIFTLVALYKILGYMGFETYVYKSIFS